MTNPPLQPAPNVTDWCQHGSWRRLATLAHTLVVDAEARAGTRMSPLLGGGTRLMLALRHRISHDIDLFIRDPQWIGYLSPRLNDRFEGVISGYSEEANAIKLRLPDGEIDFIVGMSLLGLPSESHPDTSFALEPVAEVLAKKLFYRGWALTSRDVFDWMVIEQYLPQSVPRDRLADLLKTRFDDMMAALERLGTSPATQREWAAIAAPAKPALKEALAWAHERLSLYQKITLEPQKSTKPSQRHQGPQTPSP